MHPLIAVMGRTPPTLTGGPWADITVTFPTSSGTNSDLQISWVGASGTRTVKHNWNSGGTLEYRIDAGTWTTYTQGGSGFTITSGQTVAWRFTPGGNFSAVDTEVRVDGVLLDTFQLSASGFP